VREEVRGGHCGRVEARAGEEASHGLFAFGQRERERIVLALTDSGTRVELSMWGIGGRSARPF
jgi:hypothetical protein